MGFYELLSVSLLLKEETLTESLKKVRDVGCFWRKFSKGKKRVL